MGKARGGRSGKTFSPRGVVFGPLGKGKRFDRMGEEQGGKVFFWPASAAGNKGEKFSFSRLRRQKNPDFLKKMDTFEGRVLFWPSGREFS